MTATTSDLLMGSFDSVEPVGQCAAGEIVRATETEGREALVLLPASPELAERECALLAELAGPGVPTGKLVTDPVTGRVAVLLGAHPDAVPLAALGDLPPAALRAGLVAVLRVLHRAHARGRVHGGISRASVFASPGGEFHLLDWSGSSPVAEAGGVSARDDGFSDVSADVRALGMAFGRALLRLEHASHEAETPLCYDALAGYASDPDFRRVLSRLLAPDPRDAYPSAGAVLLDLGEQDSLDPWLTVPYVPRRDVAGHLQQLLGVGPAGAPPLRERPGLIEIVGAHGAGRTRELAWVAAVLRASGAIVLSASARAAGWGGLDSLARQLVQLLGRDASAVTEHADALQWLTAAEGVVTEARVVPATLALAGLAAEAFATAPGALLLDDADDLPRAVADVWYAVGRRLASPPEPPNRALLVGTTTRPRAEHDIPRESIALDEWSSSDVARFLEGTLHAPELAGDLALRLLELAGGLPAEVVGVLRELEGSGALVRIGTRWRLEVPLHELGERASTGAEHVRSALLAAGRDAAELTELLAVAGGALSRERCSRLSALPGPRLWQAAERAEAAGLLLRDGTTWRLRSERVRRRVLGATPDARRRSLHRELLVLLREEHPDDISEIARHARAAGHADAAELTERAVARLRDNGYFDTALRHLEDAEFTLGEPDWGRARRRERAALLLQAGRLGDAATLLRTVLADPTVDDATRAETTLELVEVLYESREWMGAVRVPLPAGPAHAETLRSIRELRAAAHAEMLQIPAAEREHRLAAAETTGTPQTMRGRMHSLEAECKLAFLRSDLVGADRVLRQRSKLLRAAGMRQRRVHELSRRALIWRALGRPPRAQRLACIADSALASMPEGLRHFRGVALTSAAVTLPNGSIPAVHAKALAGCVLYEQTGSSIFKTIAVVRRVMIRVLSRAHDSSDRAQLDAISQKLPEWTIDRVLGCSFELGLAAFLIGHQELLERLLVATSTCSHDSRRVALARREVFRGRLSWSSMSSVFADGLPDATIEEYLAKACQYTATPVAAAPPAEIADVGVRTPALLAAHLIRTDQRSHSLWGRDWGPPAFRSWLSVPDPGICELSLALALGIWANHELDDWLTRRVTHIRTAYDGAWLPQLRWQAQLFDARAHWRYGDITAARSSMRKCHEEAAWLGCGVFGSAGVAEREFAIDTMRRRAPRAIQPEVCRTDQEDSRARVHLRQTPPLRARVEGLRASPCQFGSVVTVASHDDVVNMLRQSNIDADAMHAVPCIIHSERKTVIVFPELMSVDEASQAAKVIVGCRDRRRRIVVCTTTNRRDVENLPPHVRAVFAAVSWSWPTAASCQKLGIDAILGFVAALRGAQCPSQVHWDAIPLIAAIGAVADDAGIATVLARASLSRPTLITAGFILGIVDARGSRVPGLELDEATCRVFSAVAACECASVQEVSDRSGVCRRSAQRRLATACRLGLLIRRGRGRATRYEVARVRERE